MMADDDWRNERRHWRGTGRSGRDTDRWAQDDAPQFDRWDRDYPRLGYGPYARREGAGMSRPARFGRDDEQFGRYYGQSHRGRDDDRSGDRDWHRDADRFRSGRASAYGRGYRRDYAGDYGRGYGRGYGHDEDRGWLDRAGDEVASWFGDDEAEYRRRIDRRRDAAERYYRQDDGDLLPGRSGRRWRDDW